MEIFTSKLTTSQLKFILEQHFKPKMMSVRTFEHCPEMVWIDSIIDIYQVRIIFHIEVNRYGFNGKLIKIETLNQELAEKIGSKILEIEGGLLIVGGEIHEGVEEKGVDNSQFLLKQMLQSGLDESEICSALDLYTKLKQKGENNG